MRAPRELEEPVVNLEDWVLLDLLGRIGEHHRWMHIEDLNESEGERGFTRAQGED